MVRRVVSIVAALLLLGGVSASAQHPALPDFCGTTPDPLSVASGQSRTISAASTVAGCIRVEGELILADQAKLSVATLHVRSGGSLRCASATCTGVELIIRDVAAVDADADPMFGQRITTGLLGEGRVTLAGTPVTGFVRLDTEPHPGETTLALAEPVAGWQVGDQLVIPDSREDPNRQNDAQLERRTVQSVAVHGRSVTLDAPLSFRHPGARDQNGELVLLPHVMNVSRRVIIRSENPSGARGHVMFTGHAEVDIRHVEFRDLGRTTIDALHESRNPAGRYALHFHHLMGPFANPANGYQFTAIGNALWDSQQARSRIKWPIAIHNSHYGLVRDNVVYNAGGAGIVTEDGSESFNVIEGNMVARVTGNGDRNGHKEGNVQEPGSQGIGLWFRGPNNYVRNNVAVNATENSDEAGYGFEVYQEYVGTVRIPNFKGASTHVDGEYTNRNVYAIPLLEFSGNEAYGNPQGLTYWWLGTEWKTPIATEQSIFRNTTIWHVSRYPLYGYSGTKVVFDGFRVYGDQANLNQCCRNAWWGDYRNYDTVIKNATIVGISALTLPYAAQGTTVVQDSLIATLSGIVNRTSGAPGDGPRDTFPNRGQVIRNVRFIEIQGRPLRSITMHFTTHDGAADLANKDEVYVYDYQGQSGNDFRVFYKEQAVQDIAGGRAPCTDMTSRPEIDGITCR